MHKKGSRDQCENYRDIAVTSTGSRIYGKILKTKIEQEYMDMEAEEQAGFRAGRSTVDHLYCVTQIIETKAAFDQEIHLLYVDLQKAYDNDQIVIAQDHEDLTYMARKLIEEYRKWGLEVNVKKTERMNIGGPVQNIILENNKIIKYGNEYKYLGMKITQDGTQDKAMIERNSQGRKAISMINGILCDPHISKANKHRIYNSKM
ncbi:uncharacterized protein LOC135138644 [Zophobas morio]|uniref:uncharacterized protein LOC135138644 n=1 Tax=Zophobas morio TaxID=2755281 RepID=UPI003083892A